MKNEAVMRDEPGEYRVTAEFFPDGSFLVKGESARPLTLTVRVEDAWERIPAGLRRFSYTASVRRDGEAEPGNVLSGVAPDARIFLDFQRTFRIGFS
jgi:hypothetical protein